MNPFGYFEAEDRVVLELVLLVLDGVDVVGLELYVERKFVLEFCGEGCGQLDWLGEVVVDAELLFQSVLKK